MAPSNAAVTTVGYGGGDVAFITDTVTCYLTGGTLVFTDTTTLGMGLHATTFQLNLSALYGIGVRVGLV
jgi:hypothetical protein